MKYLSHYTQQATTKALESNGAFFAFSNKQFDEQKEPETVYVNMNGGLLCPKENVKTLNEQLDEALENGVRQDVKENGFRAIARREYFNHESQISMDHYNAMAALATHRKLFPDTFTEQAILEVFQDCFNEAIEQDLF